MKEILIVAPYSGLAQMAEDLRPRLPVPYSIVTWNVNDEDLDKITSCTGQGAKVIVSRGGTAQFLKDHLDIPVIEIPVTSFDILHAISKVTQKGYRNITFVTISNIIFKAEHFHRMLDMDLDFKPCSNVGEIPKQVKELAESGKVEAIIGDVTATRESLLNGIYGELLESGEESLKLALREAQQVVLAKAKEAARLKEMEAILNLTGQAVLTIDKDAKVTVYNSAAEKVFDIPRAEVIGKPLRQCLPESKLESILREQKEEKNILVEINGKKIICNRIPSIVNGEFQGAIAIFQQISDIQKLELKIRTKINEKGLIAKAAFEDIIGVSAEMHRAIREARQYAKSDGTILIYGETGTGKEIFAQSIHNASYRAKGPFASVNCASLSENLLESELFGYEEGSFTGAVKGGKMGLFELAHGGTIFLDEIGEISTNFQAKLLRVLQEKEIRRIGGDRVIPIQVRIICATNRNLREETYKNRFREDLYYRLSVLELNLAPLSGRKEDIIPLAISFLKQECIKERKVLAWQDDILVVLLKYNWPGNTRELQNFIERVVICAAEEELTEPFMLEMLRGKLLQSSNRERQDQISVQLSRDFNQMEKQIWESLLDHYNGDKTSLCRDYGISKTTLWRKLNFNNEINVSNLKQPGGRR